MYVYIYVIMKTMCRPSYHHNGFVATHALGRAHDVHKSQKFKVRVDNWGFFSYNHTDQSRSVKAYIVQTTPCPHPLFLKLWRKQDLITSLPGKEWGSEKLKKWGENMMHGQVFLKGGEGGGLTLSLFNFFKVYHFYI